MTYKRYSAQIELSGEIPNDRVVGNTIISEIKKCEACGSEYRVIYNLGHRPKKNCSEECKRKSLSEKRKKFLADNPDSHPWRQPDKKISIPCENVKKYLTDRGIDFIPEYQPLDDRFFSIDIAFPQIKVGIEINGMQHYNSDGTLKPYYQERHDLITSAGWKLIEVFYTECFSDEKISKFLDFEIPKDEEGMLQYIRDKIAASKNKMNNKIKIKRVKKIKNLVGENIKDTIFDYGIDFTKPEWRNKVGEIIGINFRLVPMWMQRHHLEFYNKECFKGRSRTYGQDVQTRYERAASKNRSNADEKWKDKKNEIFNHGIDFGKHGWCRQVAEIIGITEQKVSKWMQRHHPEFYETNCFRRRPPSKKT